MCNLFIHIVIYLFVYSFIYLFVYLIIYLFIHLFIHLYTSTFIYHFGTCHQILIYHFNYLYSRLNHFSPPIPHFPPAVSAGIPMNIEDTW